MTDPPGERPADGQASSLGPVRVSVIVPAFEAAHLIRECLRALDAQTLPPADFEVIVVDDGSADGTAEVAARYAEDARARIRVVRLPENRGPAAARNAGIEVAAGQVLGFTDADCIPAPDWLEQGLARLDGPDAPAGVEGRTDPEGTPGTLTHQMRNPTGGLFMTCNMLYRREALPEDGFDERFRAAFLEDSDVAFAVMERGGEIVFAPEVVVRHQVLHEGRRKFWNDARKRLYNPLLHAKHPDLYAEHIASVVPGLPPLHLKYMFWTLVPFLLWAVRLPGGSVLAAIGWVFYLRRLAHAYRARDVLSVLQVAVLPFVQTFWVIRGAIRFRSFSWKL